jgi:HSP20 family protein
MADSKRGIEKKEASNPELAERTRQRRVYTPDVDIIEKKDEIVLVADMPGVDEQSIDLTLEKNVLTIYGRVDFEMPESHKLIRSEYGVGDFQRAFTLSDEVDKEKIQASVRNGVLKVTLPKAAAAKTRKIEVKAEGVGGMLNLNN